MINYFRQPYPRAQPTLRGSLLTAAGAGAFVSIFLIVFQPFGSANWNHPHKLLLLAGFGAVTFVALLLIGFIGPRVFRSWYSEKNWTVGKEIFHNVVVILVITVGNILYTESISIGSISPAALLAWIGITLAVGIIPATVITLLNYTRLLRQYATTGFRIEATGASGSDQLTLMAENEKDSLTLTTQSLLYIESADNYAEVVYWENEKKEKKLLRSSLSRIEEQIGAPDIVRCHRSYIVNLHQVESISGNAQGYKLQLKNEVTTIPVARRYGERVKAFFQK
ncbi:MAG: LytTR family transcriptional regulator DNA-binding domain-containing protein [Bacteroidetes bacterium]|nr:LytTR family transcriptional regulator DNA-binding domain-containing protein [Bacteroidota bacterium]